MIEDLMVNKKNQNLEIESLSSSLTNQKNLLEESVEKLHITNRYRHELEIKYKAEKLTQERLRTTLEAREEEIRELNKLLSNVRTELQKSGTKNAQQASEIKDLKDTITTTIEANQVELEKLKRLIEQERIDKQDWI